MAPKSDYPDGYNMGDGVILEWNNWYSTMSLEGFKSIIRKYEKDEYAIEREIKKQWSNERVQLGMFKMAPGGHKACLLQYHSVFYKFWSG